ncbi:MAG TPA: hypothetical protein VGU73_10200 [Acidimicrobiia bacterium]|nr:hypothetical protein [Acidimicrobiia bacterium]
MGEGCPRVTVAVAAATVVVASLASLLGRPAAAASPNPFCTAIRSFNSSRPTSRVEALAALSTLGRAAPSDSRSALKTIARSVQRGDPSAVLAQAATAQASETDSLDQAATTVARDAFARCQLGVDFLAVVPTGLSDQPVSARVWGRTVCARLVDWGEFLMNAGSSLLTPPGGVTVTLPEIQNEISGFLDTAILRTAQLLNAVDEVGTPTIPQGRAVASSVRAGVLQAQRTFQAAQPAVKALPDDPQRFQAAAQSLVQTLDNTGRQVAALVQDAEARYKGAALRLALRAEPACIGVR